MAQAEGDCRCGISSAGSLIGWLLYSTACGFAIAVGTQPITFPHARQVLVGLLAGEMRGRIDIRTPGILYREAHGVLDHAAFELVETDDRGKDRQPGRIGRSPAIGPLLVRLEIED